MKLVMEAVKQQDKNRAIAIWYLLSHLFGDCISPDVIGNFSTGLQTGTYSDLPETEKNFNSLRLAILLVPLCYGLCGFWYLIMTLCISDGTKSRLIKMVDSAISENLTPKAEEKIVLPVVSETDIVLKNIKTV